MPEKSDKELAVELTGQYLNHMNSQMNNKHPHTDLDLKGTINVYKSFYSAVHEDK
ncbi:hypothetical protein [Apilactobacillus micheneri]|uniref:hypothetical protein n=1 Tax=Apilactobacillus micheneri TaxID=1899430 RepID=UPI00142D6A12|nr:hypothetical protein [Apilactobacillus micheneri]